MPADAPPDSRLKWAALDDFRPGIYSQSQYSLSGVGLPAGKGYAQPANTFRCIALPNGGLAPLPKRQPTAPTPPVDGPADPNVLTPFYIVGFHAYGPVLSTGAGSGSVDEVHVAIEYIYNNAGTNQRRLRWQRYRLFDNAGGWDAIIALNSAATGVGLPFQGHAMSFGDSRMATVSPYTAVGSPVVGTSWRAIGTGGEQRVWAYPDPSAPSANTPLALSTTQSGLLVAHEGRLVLATFIAQQAHGGTANCSFNEAINYTDPSNSNVWTTPGSVYAPENPYGYGCLASVNTSELLLIKNKGGAVLADGDLDAVSITRLPFVQPCHNLFSKPAVSPSGLYYPSYDKGLWKWNGGNGSSKVSNQLNDDFLQLFPPFVNLEACVEPWADWILTSNNWLLDSSNGGWWRLEDPSVIQYLWFSSSFIGSGMYAAPVSRANQTDTYFDQFFVNQNVTNFSWQSHPLPWSINRRVRIREVVVRAMAANGGTVTVSFSGQTQDTHDVVSIPVTIPSASLPQKIRKAANFSAEDVQVRIVSDGATHEAPTVFEVQVGYEELSYLNAA